MRQSFIFPALRYDLNTTILQKQCSNFPKHQTCKSYGHIVQKTREGCGCFRGLCRSSAGKFRENCGKIAGKFFPNREMLQILGFRAPGEANLPETLGPHCRDLVPTFRAGCFLKSTVPAFSNFQGGSGTEPEPETGTVGTVFPETESGTGTAGTVFQEPKPEPEPSFPLTFQSLLFCQKSEVFGKKARKPRLKTRKTPKKQGFHWKTSYPFWKPSLFCQKNKGLSLKKARVKKTRLFQNPRFFEAEKSKGFGVLKKQGFWLCPPLFFPLAASLLCLPVSLNCVVVLDPLPFNST